MTSSTLIVTNPLGLHARAAARFVHAASGFESQIHVAHGPRQVDGKSIMGLLLLGAAQGTTIVISGHGPDEQDAVGALIGLVERGFDLS